MINPKLLNKTKRLILLVIVALIVAIGIVLFGCVSMRGVLAGAMTDAARNIVNEVLPPLLPPAQSNTGLLGATVGSALFLYADRKWSQRKGLYAKNGGKT